MRFSRGEEKREAAEGVRAGPSQGPADEVPHQRGTPAVLVELVPVFTRDADVLDRRLAGSWPPHRASRFVSYRNFAETLDYAPCDGTVSVVQKQG